MARDRPRARGDGLPKRNRSLPASGTGRRCARFWTHARASGTLSASTSQARRIGILRYDAGGNSRQAFNEPGDYQFTKKRTGPLAWRTVGNATAVRLLPAVERRLDEWADAQPDRPSRSEAIRRLVERALPRPPRKTAVPGLAVRRRRDGSMTYYWVASAVSRHAAGYPHKTVRLHGSVERVQARALILTAELREWLEANTR